MINKPNQLIIDFRVRLESSASKFVLTYDFFFVFEVIIVWHVVWHEEADASVNRCHQRWFGLLLERQSLHLSFYCSLLRATNEKMGAPPVDLDVPSQLSTMCAKNCKIPKNALLLYLFRAGAYGLMQFFKGHCEKSLKAVAKRVYIHKFMHTALANGISKGLVPTRPH